MTQDPVGLTVIGGFLGAGKTSLLRHILSAEHGRKIAVLVNDFGAINVDAQLVVDIVGETVALTNGCVCCTIRDDLLTEVLRLLERSPPPDHIVIETSGVSDPLVVAQTFLMTDIQRRVDVDSITSVLDADQVLSMAPAMQALARQQIEVADLVVVNKVDLVNAATLADVHALVARVSPRARVIEAVHGNAPLEIVLGGGRELWSPSEEREERRGHGQRLSSWTYESAEPLSFSAIQRAVETLPDDIYRAKGFVRLASDPDERAVLQMTGRRAWLRLLGERLPGDPDGTQLLFIGRPDSITVDSLTDHFATSVDEASRPHLVGDLRAFSVIFA